MRITENVEARIRARDRATSLLNELTAGVVIAGVGALGVFGVVDAVTVPGSTSRASSAASSTTSGSANSGSSSSAGLQSSSGSISSTLNGSGIVVSGGS